LADWSVRNEFALVGRKKAISSLRRLCQLSRFLECDGLSDAFSASLDIDSKDDLSSWIDFLSDRAICLSSQKKVDYDLILSLKVNNYLSLCDETLQRKNFPVLIMYFRIMYVPVFVLMSTDSEVDLWVKVHRYPYCRCLNSLIRSAKGNGIDKVTHYIFNNF
jgi:hypothetical protein